MKKIAILLLALCCKLSMAQSWSVSSKTMDLAFGSIVYLESVYPGPGGAKAGTDTLTATGILFKDSARVYLVTTKHSVQRALLGKNQHLLNTNITLTVSAVPDRIKKIKLPLLTANDSRVKPYVFSSDEEDIAVLSFQKKRFKRVLAFLLKDEARPLPVDSLDLSDDHYPDEDFFHPSYMVYKAKTGAKTWSKGLGTAKIKTYPDASNNFVISDYISAGRSGSPLFVNDKIIGMVKNGEGMGTNADAIRDPFKAVKAGIVIKATLILPLIRKMQQIENMPEFNAPDIEIKPSAFKR
ncbi:hypothetical protein HQ865_04220 [Mucilaginibacter mali]|uniref:Serine protease n=1 Tax=Mucilaginibacter mali TaxID=2740462 RepID=A0A7D4Q654_9SPHI|nr:hypothetical protein [Mucilaginibacter mali]QKJ28991.1 hypothetical protein HQ865_04220 [Mucilaginibacter mali]